jgi:hypothetical protein
MLTALVVLLRSIGLMRYQVDGDADTLPSRGRRDLVVMRMIIGRSLTHLNSSTTMGMSVGVPTTRARKCKLSVQTARMRAYPSLPQLQRRQHVRRSW